MEPNKLTAAAEALIQAAVSVTESNSLALSREIAASIKDVSEGSKLVKESMENKLNTTNQHLCDLKDAVSAVKTSIDAQTEAIKLQTAAMKDQARFQQITSALTTSDQYLTAHRFTYYVNGDHYSSGQSDQLIKRILILFRKNCGFYITNYSLNSTQYSSSSKDCAGFRKNLCDQIQDILGQRPRVTETDGKTTIWYE
ncbi:hypothetical protein MPSEU_001003900 [Mayamaea pseudoterrestris]|nr:hypothetical protein MPSEU_001003900 [Mayamaea pseudoterrestris]